MKSQQYIVMKVPVKEPIEEILINLYWVDQYSRGSKSFETLHDFKEFLIDNKELAKALGYVEKEKLWGELGGQK